MPNIDPGQLLKALAPLLDKSGGMRDTESATTIVSLMKDATKLVSKCVYVNIFLHTKSTDVLQKFITNSGWNMLNKWLQEAKDTDNTVFILELLKVYQSLPVSVEDLKKDNTARFIKGLTKHANEDVQKLSASVVDSWMKKVKGKSNNENDNDKLKKRRKKDKDREKDRDKEREKDRDKEKDKEREKDRDKEKDKEREKDRDKEREKERDKEKDKEREKDRDKEKDKDREKDKDKDKEKDKDRHRHKSAEKKDSSHHNSKSHPHHSLKKDSSSNDKKTLGNVSDTVHRERNSSDSKEDSSESAEARLAPDQPSKNLSLSKTNNSGKEEEEEKTRRKPKTARVFTNKFRSVFDEDDPLPPIKKKKPADDLKPPLPLTKRNSSELPKEEPAEKIPRLTLKMPPLGADSSAITVSPTSASPPEVTHGRIKIIPPRRPPAHEIHDSNVFMNELTKASYTHGTIKRKKKPAPAALPTSKQPTTGVSARTPLSTAPATPTTPTTPNTPVSPMTATAQKLPSVPSFYRDTLETADGAEEVPTKERSPPPLEKMDTNEPEEMPQDNKTEDNSEPPTIYMEMNHKTPAEMETGTALDTSVISEGGEVASVKEESVEMSESAEGGEQKDVPTEDGAQVKKNKKRVSWAEEAHLKQVFYFELDETERENVNRPKTFSELKKQDMKSEGKAMESAKRLNSDNMVEILPWRRPPLIDNLNTTVEIGCNSVEKGIQQQRESGVLQALFFSKQMLPDSPAEAELENVEPSDTKIIPLVDETSSAEEYEHTYNVDPANMPYDPGFDITHNLKPANNGGPNNGGSVGPMGGIQLPPDINNMLASIQQQSIATGGQSLQANSAVMANVQNILASIMHGGQGVNSEELISKLRVALEPLKNQIEAPMPIMNPNEAQFRPQGQQRHGLLGNAPPGYNPMMGPRSFGPQGPGMGGGMEGDWNNMNMGNMPGPDMGMRGPMGPGFHPMQGPGPGMGGNGPVMPGPRMRNNRRGGPERRSVCRHFVAPSGCRFGNSCAFLHPGVNGPPPPNH